MHFFGTVHLDSIVTAPCCNRDNPPLKELKDASKGDRNTLQAWAERHPEEQVLSDIEKLLEGLRGVYHIENFGAIGFCIGALHSALLAGGSQVRQPSTLSSWQPEMRRTQTRITYFSIC